MLAEFPRQHVSWPGARAAWAGFGHNWSVDGAWPEVLIARGANYAHDRKGNHWKSLAKVDQLYHSRGSVPSACQAAGG